MYCKSINLSNTSKRWSHELMSSTLMWLVCLQHSICSRLPLLAQVSQVLDILNLKRPLTKIFFNININSINVIKIVEASRCIVIFIINIINSLIAFVSINVRYWLLSVSHLVDIKLLEVLTIIVKVSSHLRIRVGQVSH